MLASLRQFFDTRVAGRDDTPDGHDRLRIATAALLVEIMRLDNAQPDERRTVLRALQDKFGLSAEDADTLATLAEEEAREAVGYYQFTSLINRHFSAEQKARVVELMWQVAYADASLSAHEQHVIRKIADLLYVSHGDYIAAKLRAKQAHLRDRGD